MHHDLHARNRTVGARRAREQLVAAVRDQTKDAGHRVADPKRHRRAGISRDDGIAKEQQIFAGIAGGVGDRHEVEQPVQVLRSELALGRILLKRGRVEPGIAHLRRVRAQFLEQELVEEAGLCGLEIVEADLGRGAAREAEALARQIVSDFIAARLNGRAVTAVGYLSEAIAARKASAVTVDDVRRFIHTLRSDPDAEFLATA